jgi:hypothetical protein
MLLKITSCILTDIGMKSDESVKKTKLMFSFFRSIPNKLN